MRLDLLSRLNEERRARRAAVLVTDLASGEQRLVTDEALDADPLADRLADRLRMGTSAVVEYEGRQLFLAVQEPAVRLVVIGAVHISQAMVPMAKLVGFDVTIIDPRMAFATQERFPDTRVLAMWPSEALQAVRLDRFTALAALTHDPKIDDFALIEALRRGCFYVGALGSRRTHSARTARLLAAGVEEADLGRIHAPIGLDIGAVSPAEIAISVLAEVVAGLRLKPTRAEKDRRSAV